MGTVAPGGPDGPDVSLGRQLAAGAAPDTRASAWTWLLFAALGFLGGQVLAGIFAVVAAALSGDSTSLTAIAKLSEPPTWYIVSTLLGLWGGFFGSAWLATGVRGTKSFRRDLGLRFRWIDLIGIPIGIGGQFLVALMYIPISHHVHDFNQRFDAPGQKLTGGSHGAGFAVIASELFPTQIRASAMGFVYNIGRVSSAAAPYLIGRFSETAGPKSNLAPALCITSAAFLLAALIATALRSPPQPA